MSKLEAFKQGDLRAKKRLGQHFLKDEGAIRRIVGQVELAGMDIVEVSPPYDHAETTSMIANRAALEAISALAVKRLAGRPVRFAGPGTTAGEALGG